MVHTTPSTKPIRWLTARMGQFSPAFDGAAGAGRGRGQLVIEAAGFLAGLGGFLAWPGRFLAWPGRFLAWPGRFLAGPVASWLASGASWLARSLPGWPRRWSGAEAVS